MPPAPRPLDDLLLYRLNRLFSVAGGMVIRICEGRFGITRREWRLIATLASGGELASSQLAERAQLDRARTSKAVGSLVTKGLLTRTQPLGDRRQALLRLTPRGEAVHAELLPIVTDINRRLLEALDDSSARQLDEALLRLQSRAEAMAAEAVLPKAHRGRRAG